ncbi:hypothetical protein D0Y65_000757 [Glycine soja]|uniref:Uncharacterized protein n=1 Tax=Glycine soja TaxID=3848 RepID=A0A445M016_GLYSO|nr:hypothetical protein D0Y65_000757 [Glycine soja]
MVTDDSNDYDEGSPILYTIVDSSTVLQKQDLTWLKETLPTDLQMQTNYWDLLYCLSAANKVRVVMLTLQSLPGTSQRDGCSIDIVSATTFVPFISRYMSGLLLSRVLVGIGKGVSPSAATDLIARHVNIQICCLQPEFLLVNTIGRALTSSSICFWWFECWKCYGASFGSSPYPKSWLGIRILYIWPLGGCLEHEMELQRLNQNEENDKKNRSIALKTSSSIQEENEEEDSDDEEDFSFFVKKF